MLMDSRYRLIASGLFSAIHIAGFAITAAVLVVTYGAHEPDMAPELAAVFAAVIVSAFTPCTAIGFTVAILLCYSRYAVRRYQLMLRSSAAAFVAIALTLLVGWIHFSFIENLIEPLLPSEISGIAFFVILVAELALQGAVLGLICIYAAAVTRIDEPGSGAK